MVGSRESKYSALDGASLYTASDWTKHAPTSPNYSFIPRSAGGADYEDWPRINELFIVSNSGLITGADQLLVALTPEEIEGRMKRFLGNRLERTAAAELFGLDATKPRSWINTIDHKRRTSRFKSDDVFEWTHRPGDRRFVYLAHGIIKEYRKNVTESARRLNVVLAVASGGSDEAPYAWVSNGPMPQAVLSPRNHGRAGLFPAMIYPSGPELDMFGPAENISRPCRALLEKAHGKVPSGRHLCDYVYAAGTDPVVHATCSIDRD